MILNKVVARFKDGTIIRGRTNDFNPQKKLFHIELENGEAVYTNAGELKTVKVDIESLKALFFVKDVKGNKDHEDSYKDEVAGGGKKTKVKFLDGEEVVGYSLSFSPNRQGFFMIPADKGSNNERIFIINSAISKVEFS